MPRKGISTHSSHWDITAFEKLGRDHIHVKGERKKVKEGGIRGRKRLRKKDKEGVGKWGR